MKRSRKAYFFFSPWTAFHPRNTRTYEPPSFGNIGKSILNVYFDWKGACDWSPYGWSEATLPIIKRLDLQRLESKHSPRNRGCSLKSKRKRCPFLNCISETKKKFKEKKLLPDEPDERSLFPTQKYEHKEIPSFSLCIQSRNNTPKLTPQKKD